MFLSYIMFSDYKPHVCISGIVAMKWCNCLSLVFEVNTILLCYACDIVAIQ